RRVPHRGPWHSPLLADQRRLLHHPWLASATGPGGATPYRCDLDIGRQHETRLCHWLARLSFAFACDPWLLVEAAWFGWRISEGGCCPRGIRRVSNGSFHTRVLRRQHHCPSQG